MQRTVALVLARLQEQAGQELLAERKAVLQSILQTLLLTLRPEEIAELQQKLPVRQVASTSFSSTHARMHICAIGCCQSVKYRYVSKPCILLRQHGLNGKKEAVGGLLVC